MLQVIKTRKIWYSISSALVLASILISVIMGFRLGIDFTGGSLLEVSYSEERVPVEQIQKVFTDNGIDNISVQTAGDLGYLIRFKDITEETHQVIVEALKEDASSNSTEENQSEEAMMASKNEFSEDRFESVGPVVGQELKAKSIEAIFVVLIAIVLYVAYAFRKVSWPIQSWKYGIIAMITLFHDVAIMVGGFTLLSHLYGWEMNTPFIAAILTILGYSVNDTIVVFDRIRENITKRGGDFEETVNLSVNQTLSRSINTSFTTLLVLLAVLIFGGTTIQSFIASLIIGVVVGTYSSIFVASPLLVTWNMLSQKER